MRVKKMQRTLLFINKSDAKRGGTGEPIKWGQSVQ